MSGAQARGDCSPATRSGTSAEDILAWRCTRSGIVLAIGLMIGGIPLPTVAGPATDSPRTRLRETQAPPTSAVLIDFYHAYLQDQDLGRYRQQVASRYTEATLARITETASTDARRAAVLALGAMGTFESSNAVLAKAQRDTDPTVRYLAERGLWAIWFRADTPENNETLERIAALLRREQLDDALQLADKLVARAPRFAEAYNQRAIIYFALHRYQESANDCERVVELNPYHFGALNGLAGCQYRLDKRTEAIKTLRRALKLRPFNEDLRDSIAALEAEGN